MDGRLQARVVSAPALSAKCCYGRQCFQQGIPRRRKWICCTRDCRSNETICRSGDGSASEAQDVNSPVSQGNNPPPTSLGRRAAIGAVGLGAAAFAVTRYSGGQVTLKTLEQSSMALGVALQNKRPTVVEFYANWCEICRELTPDVYKVEQEYRDKVNFVMLNIENPKWAPEMAEYRVSGIPHFVFLNSKGQAQAAAVGRLPAQVLQRNIKALTGDAQLPFQRASGETSTVSGSVRRNIEPRSHS